MQSIAPGDCGHVHVSCNLCVPVYVYLFTNSILGTNFNQKNSRNVCQRPGTRGNANKPSFYDISFKLKFKLINQINHSNKINQINYCCCWRDRMGRQQQECVVSGRDGTALTYCLPTYFVCRSGIP
jgi:hypothetical protein